MTVPLNEDRQISEWSNYCYISEIFITPLTTLLHPEVLN